MQRIVCVAASSLRGTGKGPYLPKGTLMIWFVISIILLLFSAAVTGVALSNNVKGAGIGLIPGLVGLLLLIPACLYSVDVGEVAVIRNMGGSLAGHSEDAGFHWKTPWQSVIKYDTRNNLINFYKDTDYKYDGGSAVGKQVTVNDKSGASADIDIQVNYSLDPLCTSNVSRIDADLICAVLHGRNGKSVVEMNVCNQGNMNLLLNLLQRPGSFHGRHCTADDVAACCLQGKDLGYCCFYIFCFGIGHGLDQNGIASADLFVSNLYYFCMVSVHIFPPISKGHERDAVI